jgi:hypothetical protein
VYVRTDQALRGLETARDRLAGQIKGELAAAAFAGRPVAAVGLQVSACHLIIKGAERLASATG